MTSPDDPRFEKPLHTRQRLSVPSQPVGDPPTRFANMSLGLDAAFCNIVGLVFTLTGAFMADWLGIAGWILTVFGIVILLWSFMVTLYANRRVSRPHEVERVMKINLVVVIAIVIAISLPNSMSSDGRVIFGAFALVTAGFALAQHFARRTLR